MNFHIKSWLAAILMIYFKLRNANGISYEDEMNLNPDQTNKLVELKAKVFDKLTEDYMKEDLHLYRFLRAKEHDVDKAEAAILNNIKWRADNNMTTIDKEDFSDISAEYKVYLESQDLQGRPIITSNFGDWDVRAATVTGKMPRLQRYALRNWEITARKLRKLRAAGNKDATQWNLIVNMEGYNIVDHGCVQCIQLYVFITHSYESHFPGSVDKIMLVNTPPVFEAILDILRPIMNQKTRDALHVFGHDKKQWEEHLYKIVSPSELPPEMGGTKEYTGATD